MIAVVRLPEIPGIDAVSEMIGTVIKSSHPSAGESTSAEPRSLPPFLLTVTYTSVYSWLIGKRLLITTIRQSPRDRHPMNQRLTYTVSRVQCKRNATLYWRLEHSIDTQFNGATMAAKKPETMVQHGLGDCLTEFLHQLKCLKSL